MSTVNLQPSELSNWGTTMIYIYIHSGKTSFKHH
jgi:hypothetical protein